ncbi:MAG: FAD-binding oxidoreductase [Phycisphaeraceae bacterium]|nr:FAD-binding oxidoreductase [Phycisphaeraceae bacterium]
MRPGSKAIVIGCGVSGLSCAVKLQELGIDVEIWTKQRPEYTVSMVAAAIWHPYLVFPKDRVNRWAIRSYEQFSALTGRPDAGVRFVDGEEFIPEPLQPPDWATPEMALRLVGGAAGTLPHYTFRSIVIETPIYLPWLLGRFLEGGGVLVDRAVTHLDEGFDHATVVINCAGLGAAFLTEDERLKPVKGQLVRIASGYVDRFCFDERDPMTPIYMIPRSEDCILGGTAEHGVGDNEVSEQVQRRIIERCVRLNPAIENAPVLGSIAGARPWRDEVRLEPQLINHRGLLIHNYGHGGAGITLSLGCAEEVKAIVATAIDASPSGAIDRG